MTDIIDAGDFTLTMGIDHGQTHLYVTHRDTGKQWMSKSTVEADRDVEMTAGNIKYGITKFDPYAVIQSCDTRFWMEVKKTETLLNAASKFLEESS